MTNSFIVSGAINSEISRNSSNVLKALLKPITAFFFKNTEQGAQTTLHCALQDLYPKAKDDVAAKKLWELSERLSGLV